MRLVNYKEFKNDTDKSMQFAIENNDKTLCYTGYWQKAGYEDIISVTTQIGCRTQCELFCNVNSYCRDVTVDELLYQIDTVRKTQNKKDSILKISMVKEGDPFDNKHILDMVKSIDSRKIPYLKISSSMPFACMDTIRKVYEANVDMDLELQLQVSLSSTNDNFRFKNVKRRLMSLDEINTLGTEIYKKNIVHNKKYTYIALSFTIYEESEFNIDVIKEHFDPKIFCVRIRDASNSVTKGKNYTRLTQATYEKYKNQSEKAGFVFIDGRSAKLAVDNNLTIGLYKLKEVLI